MGGIIKEWDRHVLFRWMGLQMNGGCIIEELAEEDRWELGWPCLKELRLEVSEDGQDFMYSATTYYSQHDLVMKPLDETKRTLLSNCKIGLWLMGNDSFLFFEMS